MFSGFPVLTSHLLNLLYRQGFRYLVQQDYPGAEGKKLLSPFFAKDKAEYYLKRVSGTGSVRFYNLYAAEVLNQVQQMASNNAAVYYVKVLEKKFVLDKGTRLRIANYLKKVKPDLYERLVRNDFRIAIADNFGEVYFKIRIGPGTEIPVKEKELL